MDAVLQVTQEQMREYEDILQNFEENRPEMSSRRNSRSSAGETSDIEDFIADSQEDDSGAELAVDSGSDGDPSANKKKKRKLRSAKSKKQPKVKEVLEPTRRSARAKPQTDYANENPTSEPEEVPDESSEDEAPQSRKTAKTNKQVIALTWDAKKNTVIDLDEDEEEEEEEPITALQAHREVSQPSCVNSYMLIVRH